MSLYDPKWASEVRISFLWSEMALNGPAIAPQWPSMALNGLQWLSMTFNGPQWPSMAPVSLTLLPLPTKMTV